ncbi:MAG: hypothetical protein JSR55_01510 [Proteobacteria bacterium]|nr:hypothetical protein [Pseudomonadota bacterium]
MTAVDRSVRHLTGLGGASTSRVLNLMSIARNNVDNPDHKAKPLFISAALNRSILLRHRIRSDEIYMFATPRSVATKIIVPFDEQELRLGGRSFFVGQTGYSETLQQIGNYRDDHAAGRDEEVLRLIDSVPSLDPFLLREHLRINGFDVAGAYFEISLGDRKRMYEYVAKCIAGLIQRAAGGTSNSYAFSTQKLVSALLSTEVDEKLEPLRHTLGLAGGDFREGVFSWRGFLYYKWSMTDFAPKIRSVLREVRSVRAGNTRSAEQGQYLTEARVRISEAVQQAGRDVAGTLKTYDDAYADLLDSSNPQAFRSFLLDAPRMFLELGEKTGALSHMASFWQYRFPKGQPPHVDAEELAVIFQGFESSFGIGTPQYLALAS